MQKLIDTIHHGEVCFLKVYRIYVTKKYLHKCLSDHHEGRPNFQIDDKDIKFMGHEVCMADIPTDFHVEWEIH